MTECKRCHGTGHAFSGDVYHLCKVCGGKGQVEDNHEKGT